MTVVLMFVQLFQVGIAQEVILGEWIIVGRYVETGTIIDIAIVMMVT